MSPKGPDRYCRRVVIVSSSKYGSPWSEGVRNLMRKLTQLLRQEDLEVAIVSAGERNETRRGEFGEDVFVVGKAGGPLKAWSKASRWVASARLVRRIEGDVILLIASLTSALGIRSALLRHIGRKPTAVYVTGLGSPIFGYSIALSDSACFVGNSFLQRWLPKAELLPPFLPIGIDKGLPQEAPIEIEDPSSRGFQILYLGSLERERGVEILLQAIQMLRQSTNKQFQLVLAWNGQGKENYPHIKLLMARLGIESLVDFRGKEDTRRLYSESHVVVIPRVGKKRMSFPVRIVESLYACRPVIVSRICGMDELVEGWGMAVDPGNAAQLRDALLALIDNPVLLRRLSQSCQQALAQYNERDSLHSLRTQLEKIAQDGSRRSR